MVATGGRRLRHVAKHGRSTESGVSREAQLFASGEDPGLGVADPVGDDENGLELPHLLRQREHLRCGGEASRNEDRQPVRGQRPVRKDVDMMDFDPHRQPPVRERPCIHRSVRDLL